MVFVRFVCGLCVVCVWSVCGLCVVCVRCLCGLCEVCVWSVCGLCEVCVWRVCGLCVVCTCIASFLVCCVMYCLLLRLAYLCTKSSPEKSIRLMTQCQK